MQVPLYNIFGDNYILQLASEAKEARITTKYVEIEDSELEKVLGMASEIAEDKEKSQKKFYIPLSGNDRKPWEEALSCYNIPQTTALSQIFRGFSKVKECDEVSAPSFIKPEHYEFGRVPGKVEKEKIEVEPHYVILAAAGWVLTRIGSARVGNNEFVGVNVFSPQGGILYGLDKGLENSYIPGISPETAFSLWLSKKVSDLVKSNIMVSFLRVYIMTDAGGNKPNVINGGFTIDVGKILSKRELLTKELEIIAKRALEVGDRGDKEDKNKDKNKKEHIARDYYIRLVNYIYEYINGSKRIEDLLYFANRDLLMNLDSDDDKVKELRWISAYVNGELRKELKR